MGLVTYTNREVGSESLGLTLAFLLSYFKSPACSIAHHCHHKRDGRDSPCPLEVVL